MKNEDLSALIDGIEILQGKRVRILSANREAKKALYWIKQSLGESLRSFEYVGKTEETPAHAIISFDDREQFDELLDRAMKTADLKLWEFR